MKKNKNKKKSLAKETSSHAQLQQSPEIPCRAFRPDFPRQVFPFKRGGKEVYTYPPMLVWGSWYGNKTSRKNCTSLEVGVLALYLKDCPSSSIK